MLADVPPGRIPSGPAPRYPQGLPLPRFPPSLGFGIYWKVSVKVIEISACASTSLSLTGFYLLSRLFIYLFVLYLYCTFILVFFHCCFHMHSFFLSSQKQFSYQFCFYNSIISALLIQVGYVHLYRSDACTLYMKALPVGKWGSPNCQHSVFCCS